MTTAEYKNTYLQLGSVLQTNCRQAQLLFFCMQIHNAFNYASQHYSLIEDKNDKRLVEHQLS